MSDSRLHLTLALDPESEPITGTVGQPGGCQASFVGWVELAAVLDEMLHGMEAPPSG